METHAARLSQLESALDEVRRCLIASHNNPDPDGIAAAVLLKRLLRRKLGISCTLVYGGVVGRAENKALIKYARQEFKRHTRILEKKHSCIALVDTQPLTGNNPIRSADKVRVVFDHHRMRRETRHVPFHEVRSDIGTTSSLVYRYAREAGIEMDRRLATMLVYALWSETAELQREVSRVDLEIYNELFPLVDQKALFSIKNAKVEADHFFAIREALERGLIYGNVMVVDLGDLPYPDVVAEIADYFLRYKPVSYTFVMGRYEGELLFSIRSERKGARLGEVAKVITKGIGTAGGHGTMAGGQVTLRDAAGAERTGESLVAAFLGSVKAARRVPVRMSEAITKKGAP